MTYRIVTRERPAPAVWGRYRETLLAIVVDKVELERIVTERLWIERRDGDEWNVV